MFVAIDFPNERAESDVVFMFAFAQSILTFNTGYVTVRRER